MVYFGGTLVAGCSHLLNILGASLFLLLVLYLGSSGNTLDL